MKKKVVDYGVIDALGLFIKKLNDEAENGALVVVEGQRDAVALRSIGYTENLFQLCNNQGFARLTEKAESHKKVILLLDIDAEGSSLTKKAALLLQERKKAFDLFFRRKLLSLAKGRIRHIEELVRFKEYLPPSKHNLLVDSRKY